MLVDFKLHYNINSLYRYLYAASLSLSCVPALPYRFVLYFQGPIQSTYNDS